MTTSWLAATPLVEQVPGASQTYPSLQKSTQHRCLLLSWLLSRRCRWLPCLQGSRTRRLLWRRVGHRLSAAHRMAMASIIACETAAAGILLDRLVLLTLAVLACVQCRQTPAWCRWRRHCWPPRCEAPCSQLLAVICAAPHAVPSPVSAPRHMAEGAAGSHSHMTRCP